MLRLSDVTTESEGSPKQCVLKLRFEDFAANLWFFDTVVTEGHTLAATAAQLHGLADSIEQHEVGESLDRAIAEALSDSPQVHTALVEAVMELKPEASRKVVDQMVGEKLAD